MPSAKNEPTIGDELLRVAALFRLGREGAGSEALIATTDRLLSGLTSGEIIIRSCNPQSSQKM